MRLNQRTVGSLINVIVLGLALSDDGETKKKGETKRAIQSRTSPRVSDPRVYSSMVSFNDLERDRFY